MGKYKNIRIHNAIMVITIKIIESEQINDAACLSNQGSCSSGIWPRSGKKDAQKGHQPPLPTITTTTTTTNHTHHHHYHHYQEPSSAAA